MSYRELRSRNAVFAAMRECDALGRVTFLKKYGFRSSDKHTVEHRGKEYDSKPLLAAAYRIRFPERGPLENNFSGGKQTAGRMLVRLGFQVSGLAPKTIDWTLNEVEYVVGAYVSLLQRTRHDDRFVKSQEVANVADQLPNRNEAAVSRKFGNISAILKSYGQPWIRGYSPQANVQTLLEAVIYDAIEEGRFLNMDIVRYVTKPAQIDYDPEVEPPDELSLTDRPPVLVGTKVDFLKRHKLQSELGRRGERWAFQYLKQRYGRDHQVVWSSEQIGDGLGYDIEVRSANEEPIYFEIKTTTGGRTTPFHISRNEVAVSEKIGRQYRLMRIFDFPSKPKFYLLQGSVHDTCSLFAHSFLALPNR